MKQNKPITTIKCPNKRCDFEWRIHVTMDTVYQFLWCPDCDTEWIYEPGKKYGNKSRKIKRGGCNNGK